MQTRTCAIAFLSIVALAGVARADNINSPGHYNVTVVVAPAYTPPGVPPLGPEAYPGDLQVERTGNSWHVVFEGESASGDHLSARAAFNGNWAGVVTGILTVGPIIIPNAVLNIDVANMVRGHVNGVGLVGGVRQAVNARIGEGGAVENLQLH